MEVADGRVGSWIRVADEGGTRGDGIVRESTRQIGRFEISIMIARDGSLSMTPICLLRSPIDRLHTIRCAVKTCSMPSVCI